MAPSLKNDCFRRPRKQRGNNRNRNNRKPLINKAEQLRNNRRNDAGNKETVLSEEAKLFPPLACGSLLRSTRNFAPLALRSRYVLATLKG